MVILQIPGDVDWYVSFNRGIGMNSGTKDGKNQVLVHSRPKGNGYAVSTLKSKMNSGDTYGGAPLPITINTINVGADPAYAYITIGVTGPTENPVSQAPVSQAPVGAPPGIDYIGCFNDAVDRALPVYKGSYKSVEQCTELCAGYNYFGRQYYQECWCGNDNYDKHGKSDKCACDSTGNIGDWLNCVYKYEDSPTTAPTQSPIYMGCREGRVRLTININAGDDGADTQVVLKRFGKDNQWAKRKSINQSGFDNNSLTTLTRCVSKSKCYRFAIKDTEKNGMNGGNYFVYLGANLIVEGNFPKGRKEIYNFCPENNYM